MHIKADKEERSAVGMHIANKSAIIDVTADVGDGRESCGDIRSVMYCQE